MENQINPLNKEHPDALTWREQEVLFLLADRLTNREIAEKLHLAESTVKDYVGKILAKLYVKNRREAVEKAIKDGLIDLERKMDKKPLPGLPIEKTPFVGRKNELDEIKSLFHGTRLLTLAGPGGIGKTRLALRAAKEMTGDFRDGSFFISLTPIGSTDQLVQAIAEGINYPIATQDTPLNQLNRYLKSRQQLLIMDNFEHLLDGANILSNILQSAPEVKVLVTSREKLNLKGETILNIRGMDLPDKIEIDKLEKFDAISLFVQSANKVRPGFNPSPGDLNEIALICQFLGGMPLAIELAAAWLHILSVEEITAELKENLDILSTELRDTPERHRSIRSIFNHSWTLLNQHERDIFMRLSVFRGGFTREAAEKVAGATLPQLAGLVDKSLISLDPAVSRLEIHELLRQYALEKLGETPKDFVEVQEDHAAYFAEFMDLRWDLVRSNQQAQTIREIEADMENIRSAWRFYLKQKNSSMLWKFIYCLWYVYWIRWWNHTGMLLFKEAAEELEGTDNDEINTLMYLARSLECYFMAWLGSADEGFRITSECVAKLEELNNPHALVFALDSLTVNAYFISLYEEEIKTINKMVQIASSLEDKWYIAFAMYAQGLGRIIQEDFEGAKKIAEENLVLYKETGDAFGTTMPLIVLGHAALGMGNYEEARDYYKQCLEISSALDFYYSIQTATKYLAKVSLILDELPDAESYLRQSLKITNDIGFLRDIVNLIYEFARLNISQNELREAISLLILVIEHPASDMYRMIDGRIKDSAQEKLDELEKIVIPEIFTEAVEEGKSLDLDQVCSTLIQQN